MESTRSNINIEKLKNFMYRTGSYGLIYSVHACKSILEEIGFVLDPVYDELRLDEKAVNLAIGYGFKGEKGYSMGKILWSINEILNDIPFPEMRANFPSSMYYRIEVIKKTEKAVKDLEHWIIQQEAKELKEYKIKNGEAIGKAKSI